MIGRRHVVLGGVSGALLLGALPQNAFAATGGSKRLVFVLQRGAADGLSTLMPLGDPAFAAARGALAADAEQAIRIDPFFALHPSLVRTARFFRDKEAAFVHAVASPYRDRSHFDGQNVLETGGSVAYRVKDGWLNRLIGMLPRADAGAIAIAPTVPVILRGANGVTSYAPSNLPDASADLLERVTMLYRADPVFDGLWQDALRTRGIAGDDAAVRGPGAAAATGALAARLLAARDGARIATIELDGWDTHAGQRPRLANQLRGLDAMLGALRDGLGEHWRDTLVIVATEFGRTVAINGTGGTDHGTASVAMLVGGAVAGGRIAADWPGLKAAALHEGRDLRPTAGLDAMIAGAVADHFGLDPVRAGALLFPETRPAQPISGLIRS